MARIAQNMYGKIFKSLWEGSLRGKAFPQLVFINMICTCSPDGIVDRVPQVIADETGIPIDQVNESIALLEAPDSLSRTPEAEGRRIVRLSEHRAWGWQIVNHAFYRKCITETVKRDMNREYQARHRAKIKGEEATVIEPPISVSKYGPSPTPFNLKTQVEAIEKEMAKLRNSGGSEVASGFTWSDQKKRVEYRELKTKRDGLQKQLARL